MFNNIAVLIPCYNESKTIEKVILDMHRELPEADIYVYDNNSTDHTDDIARNVGAIVRYEHRQGKGNVIRTMFREIHAGCYLMVDGDDTYPAEYARQLVNEVLENQCDMVIGDRLSTTYIVENKRLFHNAGNIIVKKLVNFLFKGNITDIMSGYRAFSPMFVKSFPILTRGFELETEMTIHALDNNLYIKSIPIKYRDRPEGSVSKLNTYSDGFKVIKTIFRLFKDNRPFAFFSIIGLIIFLVALGLFIPICISYLKTGLVAKIPTLIVCGSLGLASLHSITCGLILDTQSKKHKQNFEVQMNLYRIIRDNKECK